MMVLSVISIDFLTGIRVNIWNAMQSQTHDLG